MVTGLEWMKKYRRSGFSPPQFQWEVCGTLKVKESPEVSGEFLQNTSRFDTAEKEILL